MSQGRGHPPLKLSSSRKARERLNRDFIRSRFPHRSDIVAVLSIAVFVCFSWSIIGFFHKLASFLLTFTLGEVAAIFAYMMAFALLESLVVTGLLALLAALLPAKWLKHGFGYKGFVILSVATVDAILFQKSLQNVYPSTLTLLVSSLVPIALVVLAIAVLHALPNVQNQLAKIQDRFLVMLFVYIPIGLLSLIAVTFRNLF